MEFLLLWYSLGAIGASLIWRDEMLFNSRLDRRDPIWCPTPRAILFGVAASIVGPVLLAVGLISSFITWLEYKPKSNNWFTRPICRRDR